MSKLNLTNQFGEVSQFTGGYVEATSSLTFDHSVGAKTVSVCKVGKIVTLNIPAAAIANGAGTVCASTALPTAYRPSAALTFGVVVIDNGTTRKAGQVIVGSDGTLTFTRPSWSGSATSTAWPLYLP